MLLAKNTPPKVIQVSTRNVHFCLRGSTQCSSPPWPAPEHRQRRTCSPENLYLSSPVSHQKIPARSYADHTLNSCFSANCRCKAQRACHKVRKDLIGAGMSLGRIFAEIRDLRSRVVVVGGNPPLLVFHDSPCEWRCCMSAESIPEALGRGRGKHDVES